MRIFHPIFVLLTLFLASKLSAQVENAIAPPEVNDAQRFFENARIQTELNELSEAQDNYLDGIDLLIQENGEYSPSLVEPYMGLSQIYILNGQHLEAVTILEEAQHISQRNFGLLNMDQIALLDEMSNAYLLMGDTIKAETIQQERLTLAIRRYGEEDPQVIPFRHKLAHYYDLSRMRGRAREQFEAILEIQQKNFDQYDERKLSTLSELVRIDILLGTPSSARRQILEILEYMNEISPTHIAIALAVLGDWDLAFGRTEKALEYYRDAYKTLGETSSSLAAEYFSTPKLINFVPPPSPVDIQGNHTNYIWGWISVRLDISSYGITSNIEVLESSPSGYMDSLYVKSLSEAVYRPSLTKGEPSDTKAALYDHQFRYFNDEGW